MRSMDSILADEPGLHQETEAEEREIEQAEAQPRDEGEKPEAKANPEAKPDKRESEHDDEDVHVPDDLSGLKKALAAARGDKRKARKQWQETERALAELRGRLSAQQQFAQAQQPKPEAPKPVDLTDEDFFGKGPQAVKAFVDQRLGEMQRQYEQREHARNIARIERSERAAKRRHEDFDEAVSAFQEAARLNPALLQSMMESDDPGEEAYITGKTYLATRDVDSIDDLERKIEAKVRAQLEAEYGGRVAQQQPPQQQYRQAVKPTIPKTIAALPGNGVAATQAWAGPTSLDDILR